MREYKLHAGDNLSHADFTDYAENAGHKVPRAVRMKCVKKTFWIASTAYARALRVICALRVRNINICV
jgi:hypothetical protein